VISGAERAIFDDLFANSAGFRELWKVISDADFDKTKVAFDLLRCAQKRTDNAIALLKELEWGSWLFNDREGCGICNRTKYEGHADGCRLKAVIP